MIIQPWSSNAIMIHTQLETLKYSVDRVGTDLYTTRAQVIHLSHELKDNNEKYVIPLACM